MTTTTLPTPGHVPAGTLVDEDAARWIREHAWTATVRAEAKHSHSVLTRNVPHLTGVLIGPSGWVYDLSKPPPAPASGHSRAMWVTEITRLQNSPRKVPAMNSTIPRPSAPAGPIAATATWQAVMDASGYRCQCTGGRCGSQHSDTGRQCEVTADRTPRGRLLAAPVDLALTPIEAAGLSATELRAWCPGCHKKATSRDRAALRERNRQAEPEPDGLFDTDSLF